MSLPDTLLVTFQTQLSAVMESVAKAAMLEVSRLVEDVFVAEVRRSRQEADGLRLQLRRKQEAERSGELMDCGAHRSPDPAGAGHMQNDIVDNADANECKTGLPKNPAATQSEDKDVMPAVELKREEIKKSPCSSLHLKDWHSSPDCEPGQENAGELVDAQPAPAQGNGEELLRNVIKKDPQTSAACGFHENLDKTDMAAVQTSVLSFELSSKWADPPATTAGLLQNHRLGTEPEFDPAPAKGSGSYLEHKLPGPARADVQFASVIDRLSFSESPEARSQPNNMLSRTIKEELIVDSDGFRESGCKDNKTSKAAMQSLTCLLQEEKAKSDVHKPNRVYHRSSTVEGEKLHFHRKSVFRLQTAIQHLHRPLKKPPYRLSSMTTAAISDAHSRSVSLHNPHRVSSTPKANPSTPSVQRIHPGDKQTSTSSRIGASWVGSKSQDQPVNRHQSLSTAASLSDSQLYRPPLHCEECDKSFPHPSNLKAHMQIHTGERPFCCPLCGRSFTKLSNLKAHRRVHTGERPYCCLACGKRFTQKCNLKRHQRIHLDI